MKARVFFLMQYEKHPVTGEKLWSQEQIEDGLDHKTIKEWAWIYHAEDKWTEQDELDNPEHKEGEVKPAHWHVAISLPTNRTEVDTIAGWFGIPMNFVEIKRGRGAFLDCVEYLTHEAPRQQELGKHRYSDEEVHANFDWRSAVDRRAISRAKYGQDVDRKTELRLLVLEGEMSLKQVKEKYPVNYVNDRATLQKLRLEYIANATPPRIRHNYYLCGGSGAGKSVASKLLAHALYPEIENDDDLFFCVGAGGATFDGYDGQPCVIWDDWRAADMIQRLGGRGNVFNIFDTSPHKQNQNVKFGAVNLINKVNIVNSVQPYTEFLGGLVGEYTDPMGNEHKAETNEKKQSYRRFPFIMPLRADDFDILINRAYLENNDSDYGEYIKYENIKGNFGRLIKSLPAGDVKVVNVATGMVRPLLDARDTLEARLEDAGQQPLFNIAGYGEIGDVTVEKVEEGDGDE